MTHHCHRCDARDAAPIVVERDGVEVATGALCDRCFKRALDGAAEWRRQFDELLAAGVGRAAANRTIIARMGGAAPS